ncbi:MAG: hypothetical protein QM817_17025 [Archangium sp.]
MKKRLLLLVVPLIGACNTSTGLNVRIAFENETQTKCLRVTAKTAGGSTVNTQDPNINRASARNPDLINIGIGETSELSGEIQVTVARFAAVDCVGMPFGSETKTGTLVRGGKATLEFRYAVQVDGGTDAGTDDAGTDAGCDTSMCPGPGDCQTGAPSCGCGYARSDAGVACSIGVCTAAGTCVTDACANMNDLTPCDAGATCFTSAQCFMGRCTGQCPMAPECNLNQVPGVCATATTCALTPANEGSQCATNTGRCRSGACLQWFSGTPSNVHVTISDVIYPDAGWVFTSPDGGECDTVISTSGTPSVLTAECGSPMLSSVIDDAGVAVFTTTGLNVGPNARVHFVGDRPAQVLIVGDATINGFIGAVPLLPGLSPAGTQPASCSTVMAGNSNSEGGGGGGYGGMGGPGGEGGPNGGASTASGATPVVLRGGCAGSEGFKSSSGIDGGIGGGAIELAATGTITISGGAVSASGAGGRGAGPSDNEGGGGGGSGGTVIIEANVVVISLDGGVTANGGGGGEGGENGDTGCLSGETGSLNRSILANTGLPGGGGCSGGAGGLGGANSPVNGGGGSNSASRGGGGGGGASGVVYVRGAQSCTKTGGTISGFAQMSFTCN